MMQGRTVYAIILFIWVGMILAVGIESIIEFNTPTLVKEVGFDVNRTVFHIFNHIQIVLIGILFLGALFSFDTSLDKFMVLLIAMIIFAQEFWLFPILSHNVDLVLAGIKLKPSIYHTVYGGFEVAKMVLLFFLGVRLVS